MALTHPLGMQLYSARKFPPFEDAMAIIAGAGYANVETFGAFYDDVEATRSLFDRYGVSVKSGHFDLDMALNDFDRLVSVARRLGRPESRSIDVLVCDLRRKLNLARVNFRIKTIRGEGYVAAVE